MPLIHALNRGNDKRRIFMDDHDRLRFCDALLLFNDERPVDIANLKLRAKGPRRSFFRRSFFEERAGQRKPLVEIHGWCLMGNHYHLLLSEVAENGISRFLQKLNAGYVKYFNERHHRNGTLFQGKTKKVPVQNDAHFLYILHYIHLNPLDFVKGASSWRENHITDARGAIRALEKYRWSSYLDYCSRKNYPSIITPTLFKGVFGNYKKEILSYVRNLDLSPLEGLTLE